MKKTLLLIFFIIVLSSFSFGVEFTRCSNDTTKYYEGRIDHFENGFLDGYTNTPTASFITSWVDDGEYAVSVPADTASYDLEYDFTTNPDPSTNSYVFSIVVSITGDRGHLFKIQNDGQTDRRIMGMPLVDGNINWLTSSGTWESGTESADIGDDWIFTIKLNSSGTYYYLNNTLYGTTGVMNQAEVDEIRYEANDGSESFVHKYDTFYILENPTNLSCPAPSSPASSTITLNSPDDNYVNNSLFNFSYNVTNELANCSLYTNISGTWQVNHTNYTITEASNPHYFDLDSLPAEGDYLWGISCNDTYYSDNRTFSIDTTSPIITLNSNNAFNSDNNSNVNQYNNFLPLNITISEERSLYGFEVNITKEGTIWFNLTNESLSGLTSYTYYNNLNIASWPTGQYDISVLASDSHTKQQISDYNYSIGNNYINYNTEEKNQIKIQSLSASSSDTEKNFDRYSFDFDYSTLKNKDTFIITSNNKIKHIKDSGYNGHLVIYNPNTKSGNWIDFESPQTKNVEIEKISDYEFHVTVFYYNNIQTIKFNSIGGLNINRKDYTWYKGNISIASPTTLSGRQAFVYANVTKGGDISDVAATLIYNGTIYNPDSVVSSTVERFSKSLTPNVSVDTTFNYQWNITVYLTDNSTYDFLTNGSQQIISWNLDNCTLYNTTAINVSFFDMNDNLINVSAQTTVYYGLTGVTLTKNYSASFDTVSTYSYCISPSYANFTSTILIQYENGTQTYNTLLKDIYLNNITTIQNLYFDSLATTQVLFTLVDQNNDPISDAVIHILKYDLGTNTYRTTEILETDDEGQNLGNIELIDGLYRFLIYNSDNELIYSNPTDSGSGIRILTNTRTFQINLLGTDFFDDSITVLGATTNLRFNNITKTFTFSWNNPTGESLHGYLKVIKRNLTAESIINISDLITSSGSLSQYIGVSEFEENTEYTAIGYFNSDQYTAETKTVGLIKPFKFYNLDKTGETVFFSAFILMAFVLLGIPFPAVSLVFLALGFIFLFFTGMFNVSIGFVAGIIIVVLIQLYKMNR